jgi:protein involved in polysaccharide export with SLBB domain
MLLAGCCVLTVLGSLAFSQVAQDSEADLVHFGDLVDVTVEGSYEFDWRGKLNPEGFLDGLNGYGNPIYGLCRNERQIAADVTAAYSKLLRNPKIRVRIIDRSDRALAVLDGAIKTPQRFQLLRVADLRELLVMSGGISDDASGEIQLFRSPSLNCAENKAGERERSSLASSGSKSNGPRILTIKISDLLKGRADSDPMIASGDLITVLRAVPIYVIGGVNDPKPIVSRPGMTLSRAISIAGGLAKESDRGRVTIYRRLGVESVVIESDLEKIQAKTSEDPELKPFDIVEVAQKNKAKRKFAPVVENAHAPRPPTLPLRIVE